MKLRRAFTRAALPLAVVVLVDPAQALSPPPPGIEVGTDRPVDIEAGRFSTIEPHLAVNPVDPRHLLGGVFLVERIGNPRFKERVPSVHFCAALASFDAGQSWSRYDFPEKQCLDPWVAFLPDGRAVFSGLSDGKTFVYGSRDGGRTWSREPTVVTDRSDHGTMIVDMGRGPFAGHVYSVSSYVHPERRNRIGPLVARSGNGGTSFGPPTKILPSNLLTIAMTPAVLTDGALVVPYVSFGRTAPTGGNRSFENGLSWVSVSTDGGKTFSLPLFVTSVCASGFTGLAADTREGPYKDRLYSVCNDRAVRSIYFVRSEDRGETWSDPLVLDRSPANNPMAMHPMVAVAPDGVVAVSWYDARNDPREYAGLMRCKDIYFTASSDGGESFAEPVRVSAKESCSATPENGEAGMRWSAGGDYHGLVATGPGKFQLLWASSRKKRFELRTAEVAVKQTRP